jgi:predicted sulfurtransferase/23S rRNA-/tRNA-specific pseudouridylate synthase
MAAAIYTILFYKYHPLSNDTEKMKKYRDALHKLCRDLQLQGRILIGCSSQEGINGTLAGCHVNVFAFTQALLHTNIHPKDDGFLRQFMLTDPTLESRQIDAVLQFWKLSTDFFTITLGRAQELSMDSPEDFKWSSIPIPNDASEENISLFPDLHIHLVSELINTGGALEKIPIQETSIGYLSPQQWHDQLTQSTEKPVFVLDCRNQKEYQLGHFVNAQEPGITTFSQFLPWVRRSQEYLQQQPSAVYMYCTGGIRCEKASAFLRREIPELTVYHLKGGIHKYLEAYPPEEDPSSLWQGRNFVFDGRDALVPTVEAAGEEQGRTVGLCVYCSSGYDRFDPHSVCTVCREPILICLICQKQHREYHCVNHFYLKHCYFTNLQGYSAEELQEQTNELMDHMKVIAVGRRFKQKRKTLQKQIDRVKEHIQQCPTPVHLEDPRLCRNCGDVACDGRCWGFFGLKRKQRLDMMQSESPSHHRENFKRGANAPLDKVALASTLSKKCRENTMHGECDQLDVRLSPQLYRDATTGIRVPSCCIKLLQCTIKAKWCGLSILKVLQNEFNELRKPQVLKDVLENGLLRYNGKPLNNLADLTSISLKSSDTLGRIVHWHEAPVLVPEIIDVERRLVPKDVLEAYRATSDDEGMIYICNKPSTVPTHPAGPYLANTLTLMVEGQEQLAQSLHPLHRTDRVTSGLTLCTTSAAVSRAFHKSLTAGTVDKLYLAKVQGRFPSTAMELQSRFKTINSTIGSCDWSEKGNFVIIDAPIYTMDAAAGIRTVDDKGKSSQSYFQCLSYDAAMDTSLLLCCPVTGRNHQLRVHLQWLSFPIINDVHYGGRYDSSNAIQESVVLAAMINASNNPEIERRIESLTDTDVTGAKKACPCCRNGSEGIRQSFTRAQLLLEGHTICLHAFRYRVRILSPKQKPDVPPLAEFCFQVRPPIWVTPKEAKTLETVSWLTVSN